MSDKELCEEFEEVLDGSEEPGEGDPGDGVAVDGDDDHDGEDA